MEKEVKEELEGSEETELGEVIEGSEVLEKGCQRYACKKGKCKSCFLKQPFVSFCV